MSDAAPSIVAFEAPVGRPENLSPQVIDRVLADFRAWLELIPREVGYASEAENGMLRTAEESSSAPVDLTTVVGQFVALRQDVNLQTRASRGQLEQNGAALSELRKTLETLERQQEINPEDEQKARDEVQRPLLKSLIDGRDALALALREVQRVQESVEQLLGQVYSSVSGPDTASASLTTMADDAAPPIVDIRLPSWARWLGAGRSIDAGLAKVRAWWARQHDDAMQRQAELLRLREAQTKIERDTRSLRERISQGVQSILTGYSMSLQRLDRAIQLHDLEAIPAVGELFDPERMEVLEVAADSGRPSGEVVAEVRRGYLWHGKVFRFAQVKVARS